MRIRLFVSRYRKYRVRTQAQKDLVHWLYSFETVEELQAAFSDKETMPQNVRKLLNGDYEDKRTLNP